MHFGIKLMSINLARAHLAVCFFPNKLMLRMSMVIYIENIVTTLAVFHPSLDFQQLGKYQCISANKLMIITLAHSWPQSI